MSQYQTVTNGESRHTSPSIVPAVDVVEDSNGVTLYADLPGVARDKLNLRVENDALIIEGDANQVVAGDLEVQHVEINVPRYLRVFTLSKELDAEKISAQLVNGVLKLQIPKAEHAQPKRIDVSIN